MKEDYSDNPSTVASRRWYHKQTKAVKKKIFKRQAKIKAAKIAAGLCLKCPRKRERPEIKLCNLCLSKQADRIKEYKINNALENKCCNCPNPADGNSSHCVNCKEKARLRMRDKRNKKNEGYA